VVPFEDVATRWRDTRGATYG